MKFLHIHLTLHINKSCWYFSKPNACREIKITIPLFMFDKWNFSGMVKQEVKKVNKEYYKDVSLYKEKEQEEFRRAQDRGL